MFKQLNLPKDQNIIGKLERKASDIYFRSFFFMYKVLRNKKSLGLSQSKALPNVEENLISLRWPQHYLGLPRLQGLHCLSAR